MYLEVNPNPPNEGDTATERRGWGERARLSGLHPSRTVIRERPQSPLGILKAVCNRRAGRDGGIGRKRGHSQTGLARVCGDVRLAGGSVAEGCRQAGDGIACRRARARLTFSAQGQRSGRCRVNRRAERMSRRASNCVGCQERWAISAGHEPRHVELFLTMAFRMVSSLRMQATKATFFALPAASSLW